MATLEERITALSADIQKFEAEGAAMKANYNESLDTIWMMVCGILVFFMHAGFSMLEAGAVRFKNHMNILGKNIVVLTLGFLCWYIFGWALAYGPVEDPNKFSGGTGFLMDAWGGDTFEASASDVVDNKANFRNWFFQGVFCATAGTIVSGAMAERTQLKGFATYTFLMTSFIYPIVVYWGWSGSGFLNYTNDDDESVSIVGPWYQDFAGSGLVHMVGGVGALCGCARKGRFDPEVDQNEFQGHNIPYVVLGTLSLWFGWFGFNPGSTLAMSDAATANLAGLVAVNTTLSPCICGLVVFFLRAQVVPPKHLDVGGFCNGILGGLVAITAGCGFVKPWETAIIGFVAAFVYQGASMLVQKLKIDDVVDAFAVHGVCGLWGVVAVGLFGREEDGLGGNGLIHGGDQLGVQLFGALVIFLWVGALSCVIFVPLKFLGALRLSDHIQDMGADVVEHSPDKAFLIQRVVSLWNDNSQDWVRVVFMAWRMSLREGSTELPPSEAASSGRKNS